MQATTIQETNQCQPNALTASQPTLPAMQDIANVTIAGENGHTMTTAEILTAKIKVGLANLYLHDLTEWRQGDDNRFGRMVDARGVGVGSPATWLRNLASICANPVVLAAFPDFPASVTEQLAAVGLKME